MIPSFLDPKDCEAFLKDYARICRKHNVTILPGLFSNGELVLTRADYVPRSRDHDELQASLQILRE